MHWIDPDHLPEITGIVDQFLVNKHGEADGSLLTHGDEIHVPPHLSARLRRDVSPGSQVKVRGVRPRGVQMIAAVAIDTPNGRVLDEGPEARDDGEAVLEDGRIIRLPPHEAERFSDLLAKGARISAASEGATTSFGTVVEASQIGASADTMKAVGPKKPKHGPDHKQPKLDGKKYGP